ncbi:MAG: hypothetical protein H6Q56_800 [Deltaproteobacteria bacterium]|nr:hypothetical protein [Deltaproteobacteria bacterium]
MPITVFDALRGNISSFLGGATVELFLDEGGTTSADSGIHERLIIEGSPYVFTADRPCLPFTQAEKKFCRELLTAFAGLYSGFNLEGYAAHFRTALLASIMDITVARSLRGDHSKGFWPIQQLIQLLKHLSYQRYEGTPATTGFIVHRTTQQNLKSLARQRQHTLFPLQPHQAVTPAFFANPLTYRYVDGTNLFFLTNIQMQVTGVVRIGSSTVKNDVERLTQRELFSVVSRAGSGAFAITVNEASEIEVLTSPAKLLVRRKGGWAIFDPDIFRSFLADSIDPTSADDLLWTAYALSKSRHGTVILIHNRGPKQLASLKKGSVGGDDPVGRLLVNGIKGQTITALKQASTLLRILSADGITVISRSGKLIETGFIIDTSHAMEVVTGGGRTTAASAASFFGKVIKVSQDGPIELYDNGRLIYRFG